MTGEEFAKKYHWEKYMWLVGVSNPAFMLPQLIKILTTEQANAISLSTMLLLFLIQASFGVHGFFLRDRTLIWSNSAATTYCNTSHFSVCFSLRCYVVALNLKSQAKVALGLSFFIQHNFVEPSPVLRSQKLISQKPY